MKPGPWVLVTQGPSPHRLQADDLGGGVLPAFALVGLLPEDWAVDGLAALLVSHAGGWLDGVAWSAGWSSCCWRRRCSLR